LKIFSPFRSFEQLALALKNRVALKFITVLNIFITIQNFLANCACPENRDCTEIFQAGVKQPPPICTPMISGTSSRDRIFAKSSRG